MDKNLQQRAHKAHHQPLGVNAFANNSQRFAWDFWANFKMDNGNIYIIKQLLGGCPRIGAVARESDFESDYLI